MKRIRVKHQEELKKFGIKIDRFEGGSVKYFYTTKTETVRKSCGERRLVDYVEELLLLSTKKEKVAFLKDNHIVGKDFK